MYLARILEIEEEVRQLHMNLGQSGHLFSRLDAQTTFSGFWDFHVKPVIELCKQMAEKYGADKTVCWLAAILHDIGRLEGLEPHDMFGAQGARNILNSKGFSPKISQAVADTILTHRCKGYPPRTLEQKILSSADAMAHFLQPFYLWYSSVTSKPFQQQLEAMQRKLERDFHDKIFFSDERESVRGHYAVLKSWLDNSGNS